jgi:hypothetical protein
VTIILLARRIVLQAEDITTALDGARRHTQALFELGQMNHAVEQLSRTLTSSKGEEGQQDERGAVRRLVDGLMPGGS